VSAPPAVAPDAPPTETAAAPDARVSPTRVPAAPAVSVSEPSDPSTPPSGGAEQVIPFDNIRRRTAEHMVRSKATSAHVYTSVEVDFERIERVRRVHQNGWRSEEGFSLTFLPFIVRAVSDVVHEYPNVNASVENDSLLVHRDLHLGI